MYIIEIGLNGLDVTITDPRKLEEKDGKWHDPVYNINYSNTGMWIYDGNIKWYDGSDIDLYKYYFVTFKSKTAANNFTSGYIMGALSEKWDQKRRSLLN